VASVCIHPGQRSSLTITLSLCAIVSLLAEGVLGGSLGVLGALGVLNDYALYKSTHSLTRRRAYVLPLFHILTILSDQLSQRLPDERRQNFRVSRTMSVDERPEISFFSAAKSVRDVVVATNVVGPIPQMEFACDSLDGGSQETWASAHRGKWGQLTPWKNG